MADTRHVLSDVRLMCAPRPITKIIIIYFYPSLVAVHREGAGSVPWCDLGRTMIYLNVRSITDSCVLDTHLKY